MGQSIFSVAGCALNYLLMDNVDDQFKINLNQNLWGLVVGLVSLGVAEYFGLCILFWFACIVSTITVVSVALTTYAYTVNYCKKKLFPSR